MEPTPVRRGLAAALAIALVAAPLPKAAQAAPKKAAPAAAAETPPGRSSLIGWVSDEQGRHAVGVRFILTPLEGQAPPHSAVTDKRGEFELRLLSYGYYRFGIETPGGVYLGSRILLIPPERGMEEEFELSPFRPEDEKLGLSRTQPVPGTDKIPVGVARLVEDIGPRGLAWFRTGTGVAVIVGSGVLAVGAVILLTDSNTQTTPVSPSSPAR